MDTFTDEFCLNDGFNYFPFVSCKSAPQEAGGLRPDFGPQGLRVFGRILGLRPSVGLRLLIRYSIWLMLNLVLAHE